jgi:hypothetical protein
VNDNIRDISQCTTQFDAVTGTTGTTLTNVVGMTSDILQPGTYAVDINLLTTSTVNSGVKVTLKWGTASMITTTAFAVQANAAAAIANSKFTTSTDAATIFGATAVELSIQVKGIIVIAVAGTLTLQAAQNAAHADTTSILVGSTMSFTPIGATTPLGGVVI